MCYIISAFLPRPSLISCVPHAHARIHRNNVKKTVVYTHCLRRRTKNRKIIKGTINHTNIDIQAMLVWLIVLFLIFAVFDPSPLTVCINNSFLHIYIHSSARNFLSPDFAVPFTQNPMNPQNLTQGRVPAAAVLD